MLHSCPLCGAEEGVIRDEITDDQIMKALASLLYEATVEEFFMTPKQHRHKLLKKSTDEGKKCAAKDPMKTKRVLQMVTPTK